MAVAALAYSAAGAVSTVEMEEVRQTVIVTPAWRPTADGMHWCVCHVGHHEWYLQHLL